MKKLTTLIVSIVFITGIPACKKDIDDMGNCNGNPRYFDVNGIQAEVIEVIPKISYTTLQTGDTAQEEYFKILCNFEATFYSKSKPQFNLFSPQSAYALTCKPKGSQGSKEGIDTAYIITKNNLSAQYSANDTINKSVLVSYNGVDVPFADFILDNKTTIRRNYENKVKQYIYFRLNTSIQNKNLPHSFTVVLKLGNGEVYTSTTPQVYFK